MSLPQHTRSEFYSILNIEQSCVSVIEPDVEKFQDFLGELLNIAYRECVSSSQVETPTCS